MIFLIVAAALVAGAPVLAAVLVSVASVREDVAKSLAGHPPGPVTAVARRLLRASVGDSAPVQRPRWGLLLLISRAYRPRQPASLSRPVPPPRWPADDEAAASPQRALSSPQG